MDDMHSSAAARAFNLLELLVVMTIITVLIAMLVPTIDTALMAGYRAQCLTNIHSQHLALMQYAHDHGQKFPPGATAADSPDYHRTNVSPGAPPDDRVTKMRRYIGNGDVMYCPITREFGVLYQRKDDVNGDFGGWDTDKPLVHTPYMWLAGFTLSNGEPPRMVNAEPEPPLSTQQSSPRHTFIAHRIDYYNPGRNSPIEMHDVGHFGSGWFQLAFPYDSHKTSEMPVGMGDGSAFVRSRPEMTVRMVIGGTYPNPSAPGMPGAYVW
jgi:prepilin-type N-terminal cleavage/methylation domain-containing protein